MRRISLLALLAAALVLAAATVVFAGGVIASLTKKNAGITSFSCDFTQETRIPLFTSSIISAGRMAFMHPDGLRWEYLTPMQEGFAVSGGKGLRWRDGKVVRVEENAAKDPLLAIISKELMTWVTLDMARIGAEYTVTVATEEPPALTLTPKRPEVAAILRELTIDFEPNGLARSVTLAEQQGGVTVIRFSNAEINKSVNIMERP